MIMIQFLYVCDYDTLQCFNLENKAILNLVEPLVSKYF